MECVSYGRNNTRADLENIFKTCDYVSLHVPLNDTTKGMIDYSLMSIMKPTAFLVNCARGPIINQNDLLKALEENKFQGAALDVFETEPPFGSDHALSKSQKVICTPHIGFNTEEALKTKGEISLDNICKYLNI